MADAKPSGARAGLVSLWPEMELGPIPSPDVKLGYTTTVPPVLVKHIMTDKVVTFFPEQSVLLAADVMRIHKFRHLPVVDAERHLVGVVSDRDILASQVSTVREVADSTRSTIESRILIRDIMTTELWTVQPTTNASAAGRMLIDHRFSCLPVTEDDTTLVGILTVRDFLRFAINAIAMHDEPDSEVTGSTT